MTTLASALLGAGLVTETAAKKAERELKSREALRSLCLKVQKTLRRGDIKAYVALRGQLPASIRSKY